MALSQHDGVKGEEGALAPPAAGIERGQAPFLTVSVSVLTFLLTCVLAPVAAAKCVAVVVPDGSVNSREMITLLADALNDTADIDMAQAAFKAVAPATAFNMTTVESKRAGAAVGCEYMILVKADVLRRNSSSRPEYYEAFAAIYTVSSRTGRLVDWRLAKHESDRADTARSQLFANASKIASQLKDVFRLVSIKELTEAEPPPMEEPPPEDSPLAKDFHPPLPYRRVRPEFTPEADLYSVEATVEIVVDIDDKGTILRTEIVRWAGYGLDESVEKTVRGMTWRPADRRGKSLPMRILLRYNFKKVAKN